MKGKQIVACAWGLSALVVGLAIIAWATGFNIELEDLSLYSLFPLFGLLAFSLMWTHYVVGAIRRLTVTDKALLKQYFSITGWAALVFILLHPTLLIFQLWQDGLGLPPDSYLEYVGLAMKWAAAFGSFAFLMFLSFETKRWFDKKQWWPVIEYGNVLAMFAIIIHGLALGSNLQTGWYRFVWIWCALSLFVSIGYIYYEEFKQAKKEGKAVKKGIIIAIVLAIITGGAVFAYNQMNQDSQPESTAPASSSQSSSSSDSPDTPVSSEQTFTAEEVKDHNSEDDCWTIISGSVYDITSYIPRHPGGDEILKACGEDGTSLFTQRTDESGNTVGSGTPHSSSAQSQLESLKIGVLAN